MNPSPTDWNAYVDRYCERTSAAFWAEPLNAVSNAAFLLAAIWLARRLLACRRTATVSAALLWPLWLLVGLTAVIGVGSFLFHTFATRWAELADLLPIQLFILAYVACFLRLGAALPWRLAWLGIPVFFAFARLATPLAEDLLPYGSNFYLPAWLGLLAFATYLAVCGVPAWRTLAAAAGVFTVSLTLRTLDLPLCPAWPIGTHFLWHLLNALTLALATVALLPRPAANRAAG